MKRLLLIGPILALLAACATKQVPQVNLSGQANHGEPYADGLWIGLVADSQLQTQSNDLKHWVYRGRIADWVSKVAIRPPALDLSARSMLRNQLHALADEHVKAIFYLGDGANNGCLDEFTAQFEPGASKDDRSNDVGLLALLDAFRTERKVPVYFVLGNHDVLGAGSTAIRKDRELFCRPDYYSNRPLTKFEVIKAVDQFNRANDRLAQGWTYRSNLAELTNDQIMVERCGPDPSRHHRRWGCYLAASLETRFGDRVIQFLLLDTNDWADIKAIDLGFAQFFGKWGGMSIGEPRDGIPSQIEWFTERAGGPVDMRIALSHYDVAGLQKKVRKLGALSRLSRRIADLFSIRGNPRTPRQLAAFFLTGHTHDQSLNDENQDFEVGGLRRGEPRQLLYITELNVGSTTDYSNYSALVELRPSAQAAGEIRYKRIKGAPPGCDAVRAEIAGKTFQQAVGPEQNTRGWAALGIDPDDRSNYLDFSFKDPAAIRANWKQFVAAGNGLVDDRRAACIGLEAARIEHTYAHGIHDGHLDD